MTVNTSARGLRYPDGDESVASTATSFSRLVTDIEAMIKAGVVSSGTLVAGATTAVNVTFPTAFPAGVVPVVTATVQNAVPTPFHVSVLNITNTGFTLYFSRDSGTAAFSASYMAVRV